MKRSNLIVALGLAVFVVGAAATYLVLRDDDGGGGATAAAGESTVLYASQAIPVGTTGDAALSQGMVETKAVESGEVPAGALTDAAQLSGRTSSVVVPEGSLITSEQFPQGQTGIGTLKIPDGKSALAVQLGYVPGVAGFVQAGDHIDIYSVVKDGAPGGRAQLVIQDTEVLHISTPTAQAGQAGGAEPIFLLAVTPPEAERIVYLSNFQEMWFSLVPRDQAPVPATPGSGLPDASKLLP